MLWKGTNRDMRLEELLRGLEYRTEKLPPLEITDVTMDSRAAGPGMLFACVPGGRVDGHDFAKAAEQAGCAAILAEHPTASSLPHILVPDARKAYALVCANLFGNPAASLRLFGVTGTNGKTTTAFLLKHILEQAGARCGLIGTIVNMAGDRELPSHYTTPEPHELHRLFAEMLTAGCDTVVMEASSQALAQHRLFGLHFDAAIFTNLTQDHLDYHKTMENYLKAKQMLFEQSSLSVVNLDDPHAQAVLDASAGRSATFSMRNMQADYTARNIRYRVDGTDYDLVGLGIIGRVRMKLPGSFNVSNSLAAITCAVASGVGLDTTLEAMHTAKGVKGRLEALDTGRGFTVIFDYAHTPDGLSKTLDAVDEFKQKRVICVFGCGGDRDHTKRPQMGTIAAQKADFAVVTSDNPRSEEPMAIINDILAGMKDTKKPYKIIENRREAIAFALKEAKPGDIVLLAGKGHEDYQIVKDGKIHFDEREVVAELLSESAN